MKYPAAIIIIAIISLGLVLNSKATEPTEPIKHPRVEIVWNDAWKITKRNVTEKDIVDFYSSKKYQQTNIGYIVYENNDYVVLAGMMDDSKQYNLVMMIPKPMIQKIIKL